MHPRQVRRGFTLVGLMLVILTLAVIALAVATVYLYNKGAALTEWVAKTDDGDPTNDFGYPPGEKGLTDYLRDLSKKVHDHIELNEPGHTVVHTANDAPDHHLDPPPPPGW